MNQTELPECEKINKKEPSKDVQMTQEQADRLVEHLKNVFMYVRVLRPDEIGDFIIDEENGKLCECYAVWNLSLIHIFFYGSCSGVSITANTGKCNAGGWKIRTCEYERIV